MSRLLGSRLPMLQHKVWKLCEGHTRVIGQSRGFSRVQCVSLSQHPGKQKANQKIEDAKARYANTWPDNNSVIRYSGNGVHLGIRGQWSLTIKADGAFLEEFKSPRLSTSSGFSGAPNSKCWEVDSSGTCKELELDDHEVCLLTSWVRTGMWLRSEVEDQIDAWCHTADQVERPALNGSTEEPTADASVSGEGLSLDRISIRLKNKKVIASTWLNPDTLLAEKLMLKVAGKPDTFTYNGWKQHGRHWFAGEYVHSTSTGQSQASTLSHAETLSTFAQNEFCMPPIRTLPSDTTFKQDYGGTMKAWWSSSGHIVVQPLLNGSQKVYMILDTGASGFVIEKEAADKLGMSEFGTFHCHGMMQHVPSRLRQCSSIRLGPVTMDKPIFMEMPLTGIVKGGPGPIVGIIGYDVFRRVVMQIPEITKSKQAFDIQLHNPATYDPPKSLDRFWHELDFISNLPILRCTIGVEGGAHDIQLMIDSGAGGVDLMFNKRATDTLGIVEQIQTSTSFIKGVGGNSDDRQAVKNGKLPWLSISESRFENLDCLFVGDVGLDLSHYVQGIMCGELLARGQTILDFARKRIAFVPADVET